MTTQPDKDLQTFANPYPQRDYNISVDCPEFTCLCPMTGQPDFACMHISYIPDQLCIELKSLKLYLWSYRSEGSYHEAVTNKILDDLVAACSPRKMAIHADFKIRGGIHTCIDAKYTADADTKQKNSQPQGLHKVVTTREVDYRPWGHYEVLIDAEDHKVKSITVNPGKRLSLQRHQRRIEHWTIVKGLPLFTLDGKEYSLKPGDVVDIPQGSVHRIQNPGKEPVVFIEVQRGDYFGEDDIERLEDDFGRTLNQLP